MKILLLFISFLLVFSISACIEKNKADNSSQYIDSMGTDNFMNNKKHRQEIYNLDSMTTENPHIFN